MELFCILCAITDKYQPQRAVTVLDGNALCNDCLDRERLAVLYTPRTLQAIDRARHAATGRRETR